jgi:hypothetical protein
MAICIVLSACSLMARSFVRPLVWLRGRLVLRSRTSSSNLSCGTTTRWGTPAEWWTCWSTCTSTTERRNACGAHTYLQYVQNTALRTSTVSLCWRGWRLPRMLGREAGALPVIIDTNCVCDTSSEALCFPGWESVETLLYYCGTVHTCPLRWSTNTCARFTRASLLVLTSRQRNNSGGASAAYKVVGHPRAGSCH